MKELTAHGQSAPLMARRAIAPRLRPDPGAGVSCDSGRKAGKYAGLVAFSGIVRFAPAVSPAPQHAPRRLPGTSRRLARAWGDS